MAEGLCDGGAGCEWGRLGDGMGKASESWEGEDVITEHGDGVSTELCPQALLTLRGTE